MSKQRGTLIVITLRGVVEETAFALSKAGQQNYLATFALRNWNDVSKTPPPATTGRIINAFYGNEYQFSTSPGVQVVDEVTLGNALDSLHSRVSRKTAKVAANTGA